MVSMRYIFDKKCAKTVFVALYCACIAVGSVFTGELVWECADIALGGMTIINLFALIVRNREVKEETEKYFFGSGTSQRENKIRSKIKL